jgi:2-keto-4-pentenoate hydratase/2-oxohepta-3-ene-1,7-dioic acid hydratase in catechol pathway
MPGHNIPIERIRVYHLEKERIAGYLIFNDLSARDVQFPEISELSLTRSKDFDNGIG